MLGVSRPPKQLSFPGQTGLSQGAMQRKNERVVSFQQENAELPICSSTSSMFPGRTEGLHPQRSGAQPQAASSSSHSATLALGAEATAMVT